jgi:ribosomal protein L17
MAFQPGNQESKKADHKKAKRITQQLISALEEPFDGSITKLRKVVDALVANAMSGDQQAIREVFDRVDGKPAQTIVGDDDADPIKHVIQWKNGQ